MTSLFCSLAQGLPLHEMEVAAWACSQARFFDSHHFFQNLVQGIRIRGRHAAADLVEKVEIVVGQRSKCHTTTVRASGWRVQFNIFMPRKSGIRSA